MDGTRLRDGVGDTAPARRQASDRGDIHDPPVLSRLALNHPLDLVTIIHVGLNADHSCAKGSAAPLGCGYTPAT
jgi:hypothetical protein